MQNHKLSTESYVAVFHADEQFINLMLHIYCSYEISIPQLKAISLYFVQKNNLTTESHIAVFRAKPQVINWKLYRCISCRWTIYQLKVI